MGAACVKIVSISDDLLGGSDSMIIQREGIDSDNLRVLVTRDSDQNKRYHVRLELEPKDIENLIKHGGSAWLTFYSEEFPEFSIFTTKV